MLKTDNILELSLNYYLNRVKNVTKCIIQHYTSSKHLFLLS